MIENEIPKHRSLGTTATQDKYAVMAPSKSTYGVEKGDQHQSKKINHDQREEKGTEQFLRNVRAYIPKSQMPYRLVR